MLTVHEWLTVAISLQIPKDLEEKVTEERKWVMKKILDHRELDHGSLQFRFDWAGDWERTWEPRAFLPEEAIYRYCVKRRRRDQGEARRTQGS